MQRAAEQENLPQRSAPVSIDDRDWYREATRDRDAWPHPLSGARGRRRRPISPIAGVVLLMIAMFGSALAHQWWQRNHPATSARAEQKVRVEQRVIRPIQQTETREDGPVVEVEQPRTTLSRQVMKCVVNGTVSYSAGKDCASVGRIVRVDPSRSEIEGGLSQYQIDMLRSADARIAQDRARAEFSMGSHAAAISTNNAECAALDQQIRSLDERSRRPISAYEQDVIRAERAAARSRQYALHC